MSGSGFRGRGIEPWGIPNGFAGPFRGVYSSNPRFYHPRLPHGRLPTPENWSGRSNYNKPFLSWKNGKFQPSVCRNKFNFRSKGRGRGTIHRGALHFPSSNTPSIKSPSLECNQNVEKSETMLIRDQYGQDKFEESNSYKKQTPLLGSEEEHQQKITETAVRLKEKLSNITKEDISNLWKDDVSTSSSNVEGTSIFNVSIPNLSYKEPDLNLTFNDFKDIGRIDLDHSMSDKHDGTNIAENASNFVQDTVKKGRNKAIIEVINLIEIEQDVHDVESMTVVKNITNNKSHNNNDQKFKKKTTSSHSISLTSSTDLGICDAELVNSLKFNTTKTDLLKDQTVLSPENTQVQDHHLTHQPENEKSDDNFNLENPQKSHDGTQQEQVNSMIEMQYSLHRSLSKITKKKSRWTPLPYETSSLHRKPFKSRWLRRKHNYMYNKSKNELAEFDSHTPSSHLHRDTISLCQNSQYNTSLNLSECVPSDKSSTIPKLMHNQDNSQSMLCVDHDTSYSIFTNVSSSQEHILQTSAFDSQKSSHSAIGYNMCNEKVMNIPNFDPQQPPPNFNNQKGTVPLSPALDSHILSQEISNFKIHALDSSQLSAVSTSTTDLYYPAIFSTTQGTTTLSTLSQSSVTSSPNLLSNVPNNASPILTYTTSLQMTPYEISSTTRRNNTDQVSNQHNIVEVKDELEEMQEAMQFARQAMNVTNINNIDDSNQVLHSGTHLLDISLEQGNISDASPSKLQKTANKAKEKLNKHSNKSNNKKGQVISESRVSSELGHENQLSQNCNVEENTLLINEQNPTKLMFNLNPILNKINKQGKLYQRTETDEKEKYVSCKSHSNMYLKECSNEKKKTESPSPESSWKTRIINRFLKMSKNDIRNMINNCSLRKFDIAMKHLVKEKKSSLSLEMRNIQDEKIKGYDGEEFMNQLNAMLDPAAIVDITNLPTEFIRHLSEVLQLDAIPLELTENVSSQFSSGSQCNNADALTALRANEKEMLNKTVIVENVNVLETNNRTNGENNNQLNDYCNRIIPSITIESSDNDNNEVIFVTPNKTQKNKVLDSSQISSKIRSETNDLNIDHIKHDTNTITKNIRQKNIEKGEQHSMFNMADLDEIAETSIPTETASTVSIISKNKTSSLTKHHGYNSEDEYISKSERYSRWTRREREGPDAFRNLTKEEWEAKYGRQTKSSSNPCEMQISRYYNSKHANTRYNKTFNTRRHHSPLSLKRNRNYKTDISKRILKKDKNTETFSSTSNTSESDDTSTSSDNRTPSEVTKLLKVIKEKEKIAKNKSLNETIRDEVTAEIQRKWNEEGKKRKYYTKDKRKKEKRSKYKKERKKKRRKVFDSSSSDNDKADRPSLLAETEIKKETINKEESETILEKSTTYDTKTVNNGCSNKEISTKLLTDKRISPEIKEKCTIQENDKCTPTPTIIQPKTKAQLKLIPSTSKHIEETEFMKNTAKIVLNAKCMESKTTILSITDKPRMIEKIQQEDTSASGINVASEYSDSRLVDIIETEHTVFNNNDNTKKNLINASISKEEHGKDKTGNLTKDISSVFVEAQDSTTKTFLVNKEVSKKIDIKAYKARALQRKLENEDKIKEKQSTQSNNISKSITEEMDKSNTVLEGKYATIEINKLSIDSNKFKNIKSEGKKELKLKNKKIKKNAEIKAEIKNTKGMLSDNQETINDISDVSKLVRSEVENDLLDAHMNTDKQPIQKYSIQNKEICFNNAESPKNILKETEDERDERIVNNVNTVELANIITEKSKCIEELQIINPTEALNNSRIENKTDESLSDYVKDPTNLELNLINVQDVSKTNMIECSHISIHSTNSANANLLVPLNEQNINVKENIVITDEVNQKLLENLENLEILKVHSPESVGSPFKGFEPNNDQHVEINDIITANEDNVEIDKNEELQACNNVKYNWQNVSSQNISADNNNISFRNIFNDSLNRVGERCTDKEQILYEKSSEINEGVILNLNNNTKLLDSDNDKDKKEKSTGQIFVHVQNDKTNIPYTSSEQHKMPMLDEYEDNAVMEKSDIDILNDSSFKDQSCTKNIGSICASTDANPLNIHNPIASSFSEISNETSKTTIDTNTELSLNSLVEEDNATDHNSTFKDIPNQNIINITNQNSHKEESINNNDSFSNNSIKSFVSAGELYKSSSQETLKKLQIPTKAALKESRNIFAIMDGSFSSIKEIMELKDPCSKLNVYSDQEAVDFLSDQISQKENINNEVIDLEQKSSHSMHTYMPGDTNSHRSTDTESLSKTALNNVKIIHDDILTSSNHSNCIKDLESHNTPNPVVNLDEIEETNKGITNTIQNTIGKNKTDEHLKKLSCTITQKQEQTNNLHKINTKQVMQHPVKNTCKSNSVHITNKNIKEEIMARMIEIDVEIHKLMTEKMTLYQMLENDSLLLKKVPLNSNLGSEINKEKILPVGLQTLSSSVSRIIQNAEISEEPNFGEHSDCIVTSSRENTLSEISQNQAESKIGDIYESKQKSLLQEEDINAKQLLLTDSLEDGTISENNDSLQSLLLFKDEDNIQKDGTISLEDRLEENEDTSSTIEETLNNLTENSSLESMTYFEKEEQLDVSSPLELTKPSNESRDAKHTSDEKMKQNVQSGKTSKNNNSINASLIYSDDSTWSSFAQSFEEIERKKHNTGLALLEETYKREIAENKKLKASARKKKKKELNKFLKSVNYLTPEEEEIPLNTLYIKKLQQKRDLLDSLDEKKENSVMDSYANAVESEEVWKHALEVINAVAEDRVKDLYVEKAKESRSEMFTMPSYTSKQNEEICISETLTNLNKPLQNLNEAQITSSLLTCDPERNSIKCSLAIIEKDIILQSKKKEGNNENKKNNVQSTVNSSNNLEINPAVTNMPSDNTITQEEISLVEPLFNADYITNMSAVAEANELNISNKKLNKNQNTHISQTNSSNENTTMNNTLTYENCKYNNKTEEINIKSICLLKNKEIDIPKIGCEMDETVSNTVEKMANITNNSLKKCKDQEPITINTSEAAEISDKFQSSIIHDKKILKRKNSNKNIPISRKSKYAEDNVKYIEHNDTNSRGEKDPPKVRHDSKSTVFTHQDLESTSSNVKRNRNSQKLQTIKDKKYNNGLESKESISGQSSVVNENLMERKLPNVDVKVSKPNVQGIGVKRKIHDQSELMNCKVVLIDILKSNMYRHTMKKCHTSFTTTHVPHISNALETTTNSAHRVTSSKINSSIVEAIKLKDIPKSKHSCISDNVQEHTSNSNQKHVTKIHNTLDNTKELKFHHKVKHDDILHNDEHSSLESNCKDILIASTKPVTSNVKILPQDKKTGLDTIGEIIKEQCIVHQPHDERIPSPDALTENVQPLKTHYIVHKGPILDIKVFGDTFLAASEDGSIYRYSQVSNGILNIYKGHRSAVTCLYIHKSNSTDHLKDLVYSGSLDGTLRCYNIKTGASINNIANIGSPIQCMDQAWGIIFIGTKSGHVSRFHIKFGVIKGDNIQFSNKSVLALKATNEGPRKVLIVASRNQPITIRDAQNGLFLRTICGQKNHTVYSLMLNNNLIYCGTSSTSILVFDFTNGEQKVQYNAGVGIVCMRLYHKLLFAGCYDGNIYVFDIQDHRLICSIPGPGNMLLSMEVVDNKIIAGSKDKRLHTWQMPKQVQVVSREKT